MSSQAAEHTGPLSATGVPASGLSALLRMLGALFHLSVPVDRERTLHLLLLAVLVAIGAGLRFWNLGAVSLHGDEETMAMAARHILIDGRPILPSGMFYPRGMSELYLMAASAHLFGESEWAFRLPSALCGIALIGLAFVVGRRFLRPQWNLAFAATIALLPAFIEYSQTARMYIFMLTCIAGCLACIFAWERSDRIGWLIGAVLALVLGIELYALAVTCVLLFLLPGVLRGDARKLALGLAAASVVMLAYLAIESWVSSNYPVPPPEYAADIATQALRGRAVIKDHPLVFDIALWVMSVVTAFLAVHFARAAQQRWATLCASALLVAGLVAQLMLFYHIAVLLALAGTIIAYRFGASSALDRFWRYVLSSALIVLIHVSLLASWPGSAIKLVGAVVGQPSVWPYVRVMEFSVVAGGLAVIATALGLWRIANRQSAADYWLLALLGVWIPVFVIGFFQWDIPARYTSASLLPMLLCAFAFAQYGVDRLWEQVRAGFTATRVQAAAAVVSVVLFADPASTVAQMPSYVERHPDHKGAAQFMRTLQLRPDDIVLAEDVLQQTYYLGHVDYWLISRKYARHFVQRVDGRIRDFYTGTAVIDSGAKLQELLDRNPDRRIFVIGSAENRSDQRQDMRGYGIADVLLSDRFEVLYTGRDGFTAVWRAKPGSATITSAPAAHRKQPAAEPPLEPAAGGEEIP